MRVYTVHTDLARDFVLVKEGFSWPAFFFTFVWAFAGKLWLWGAVFLGVAVLFNGFAAFFGLTAPVVVCVSIGLHAVIGFVANDLRRRTLHRRGYTEICVVTGANLVAAETRFLEGAGQMGWEYRA